nr:protein phosphatase CheZ [Lysobacter sp. GX 14042]
MAALAALEHDDEAGWRRNVDELIQWRAQPLVQGITRLARELEQALLGEASSPSGTSLPEACARLEHVVALTENASMRTLDLVDECSTLLRAIEPASNEQAALVAGVRSRLSELTATQGYQDLTGQIILRVVALVRTVHAGLGEMIGEAEAPLRLPADPRGHGPAVAGLDAEPASQDEANRLLSSLGI